MRKNLWTPCRGVWGHAPPENLKIGVLKLAEKIGVLRLAENAFPTF